MWESQTVGTKDRRHEPWKGLKLNLQKYHPLFLETQRGKQDAWY